MARADRAAALYRRFPEMAIDPTLMSGLTFRELEIASLLLRGHRTHAIAQALHLSPRLPANSVSIPPSRGGGVAGERVHVWLTTSFRRRRADECYRRRDDGCAKTRVNLENRSILYEDGRWVGGLSTAARTVRKRPIALRSVGGEGCHTAARGASYDDRLKRVDGATIGVHPWPGGEWLA